MTATGHALVGAAIATQFPNPLVGLPLALASHFLGDKLPHWDVMTDKNKNRGQLVRETILDVLVGYLLVAIIFVFFLGSKDPLYIFLGAFFAQLPDFLEAPYLFFKARFPLVYGNYRLQKWVHDVGFDSRLAAPWGIITQAVVVLFFIWLSLRNLPFAY